MARLMLSDEVWSKLGIIMLQQGIYDKPEFRLMVEAMLYRMRVGCPWRDLPAEFGNWNTIYQKFNRWSCKDKLVKIFKCLVDDPDLEWAFIDGRIVRAHQHSAGAIGKENQAIGKSVGGNTTKIYMAVDAFGLPIEFDLTGGEMHDSKAAPELIARLPLNEHMLVYYEIHSTYLEVARRETRFKNWCRKWKLNLIEELNPTWRDLYDEICT